MTPILLGRRGAAAWDPGEVLGGERMAAGRGFGPPVAGLFVVLLDSGAVGVHHA